MLDRSRPALPLLVAATLCLAAAQPLHAQSAVGQSPEWRAPMWVGDVTFLGLNAVTSGVSAGVLQRLRGGSFSDGFTQGAFGGAVHYAGMRLAAQRFDGAGFLGRQVSATGISVVRNAAEARPALEQLFFPVGPLHVFVRRDGGPAVRAKVNMAALTTLVYAALRPELEWDAGASVSAGAPVFRAPGRQLRRPDRFAGGMALAGTIIVSDLSGLPPDVDARVLAHERVHVLQGDWRFHVWSDPIEDWLLQRVPGGGELYRHADVDLVASVLVLAFNGIFGIAYENRLSEIEASFLDSR